MKPIIRSYLTEVNLGAAIGAGQQKQFQDYPVLRDAWCFGIEVLDSDVLSPSPQNSTVVPALTGLTLTMVDNFQAEIIKDYPCFDLNPAYQGGLYREFVPFQMNLTKSYFTIRAIAGLAANQAVLANIFYMTNKDYQRIMLGVKPKPGQTVPRK